MKRALLCLVVAACGGGKSASGPAGPGSQAQAATCVATGCSGSVCAAAGNDVMTTCEMKPEYQCYQGAECKAQADGACGWTMDDRLQKCLASPPPM